MLKQIVFVVCNVTLKLNTTVYGAMKATPYELVFEQPPREIIFPGAKGKRIMEEDVEDLLDTAEEEVRSGGDGDGTGGADDCGTVLDGSSVDEGLAGETFLR